MTVLAAEPVEWRIEYRCFVLDRRVTTLAPYLRGVRTVQLPDGRWPAAPEAEAAEVLGFAGRVLADGRCDVAEAVVMDVGYIEGRGWAVVEFNPAWCSTLYGCRPADALPVLRRACRPVPAGRKT